MTHDRCWFLSFKGNNDRIFFVFQIIRNWNLFLVKDVSLAVNFCASFSFVPQNGSRIRTVCLSSNNQCGIKSVSVDGVLNSLIVAAMKCFG